MAARPIPWNLAPLIARLSDICESTPEIVFFSRPDGYCEYLNDRFYRYTGLTWRLGEGNGWEVIVHPDDREPNLQRWLASQSSGRSYALCNRLRCDDGSIDGS